MIKFFQIYHLFFHLLLFFFTKVKFLQRLILRFNNAAFQINLLKKLKLIETEQQYIEQS